MPIRILILSDSDETRGPVLKGWLQYYAKDAAEIVSAGLQAGKLNPFAAKAMMEAVIDITKHKAQKFSIIEKHNFDKVIALTPAARALAEQHFGAEKILYKPLPHPFDKKDDDMEKLKKHRETVNTLEEVAIEFVHQHIRKLI